MAKYLVITTTLLGCALLLHGVSAKKPAKKPSRSSQVRAINMNTNYAQWNKASIPYCLDSSLTTAEKQAVTDGIQTFVNATINAGVACFNFVQMNCADSVYKLQYQAQSGAASFSVPGMNTALKNSGAYNQAIILSRDDGCSTNTRCAQRWTVFTMGKLNEHQRLDRDQSPGPYISMNTASMSTNNMTLYYRKYTTSEAYLATLGYDYCSITHNQPTDYANPGTQAFTVLKAPYCIPQQSTISNIDCNLLLQWYSCPKAPCSAIPLCSTQTCPTTTAPPSSTTPASSGATSPVSGSTGASSGATSPGASTAPVSGSTTPAPSSTPPGSTSAVSGSTSAPPSSTSPGASTSPVSGSTSPASTVSGATSPASSTVSGATSPASSTVSGATSPPSSTVSGATSPASSTVSGATSPASSTVSGATSPASSTVSGATSPTSSTVSGATSPASSTVSGATSPASSTVSGATSPASSTVSGATSPASSTVSGATSPASSTVSGATSPASSTVSGATSPASSTVSGATSPASSTVSGATSPVSSTVSGATSPVSSTVSGATSPVSSTVSGATSPASSTVSGATSPASSTVSGATSPASSTMSGATSPASSTVSGATSPASSTVSGATSPASTTTTRPTTTLTPTTTATGTTTLFTGSTTVGPCVDFCQETTPIDEATRLYNGNYYMFSGDCMVQIDETNKLTGPSVHIGTILPGVTGPVKSAWTDKYSTTFIVTASAEFKCTQTTGCQSISVVDSPSLRWENYVTTTSFNTYSYNPVGTAAYTNDVGGSVTPAFAVTCTTGTCNIDNANWKAAYLVAGPPGVNIVTVIGTNAAGVRYLASMMPGKLFNPSANADSYQMIGAGTPLTASLGCPNVAAG